MKKYQYGGGTSYGQGGYSPSFGSPYIQQTSQIQQQAGLQELQDKMQEFETKGELDIAKRGMTKDMQKKMEREMEKAQKKAKNIGLAGNILGFGLNFVPGLQGWGAAGVQSLVSGLQTKLQQEAMEKAADFNLGKGTFLESAGEDYKKQVKEMAEGYDPLASAATSMLTSAIGMGVEKGMKGIKKTKEAAELGELADVNVEGAVKDIKGPMSEEQFFKEKGIDTSKGITDADVAMYEDYVGGVEGKMKAATDAVDSPDLLDAKTDVPDKVSAFDRTAEQKKEAFFGKATGGEERWAQAQEWLSDPRFSGILQGLIGEDEEGYGNLLTTLLGSFGDIPSPGGQQ